MSAERVLVIVILAVVALIALFVLVDFVDDDNAEAFVAPIGLLLGSRGKFPSHE